MLLLTPQLLLLDEPGTGLDSRSDAILRREIRAARARGAALVWVSHQLERDLATLERHFSHTGSLTRHDGQPGWALQLTPREPALARMIQRIELKGSSHAEEILLKTEAGDTTRIEFLRMTAAQALTPAEVAEFE